MLVREAVESINRPRQDWEPRVVEVGFAGHRTGAVVGLTSAGVKVGKCPRRFPEDTRWSAGPWKELRGLLWEFQPKHRNMPDNLADEAALVLAPPPDKEVCKDIRYVTFTFLDQALRSTGPHLVAERVRLFPEESSRASTPHSDECRQRIMEAVEEDGEDRMRAFLDRHVQRRLAPVLTGGGSAEPAEIPVRTSGAASSSSSGGAQPSPMETGTEERKRGHSSGSAPASAGIPVHRQTKRTRFEVPRENGREVKKRLSTKRKSETDA